MLSGAHTLRINGRWEGAAVPQQDIPFLQTPRPSFELAGLVVHVLPWDLRGRGRGRVNGGCGVGGVHTRAWY
jgi:hypothetical protein